MLELCNWRWLWIPILLPLVYEVLGSSQGSLCVRQAPSQLSHSQRPQWDFLFQIKSLRCLRAQLHTYHIYRILELQYLPLGFIVLPRNGARAYWTLRSCNWIMLLVSFYVFCIKIKKHCMYFKSRKHSHITYLTDGTYHEESPTKCCAIRASVHWLIDIHITNENCMTEMLGISSTICHWNSKKNLTYFKQTLEESNYMA